MTGHTPGPWRWEVNAACKTIHLCGGRPQFDKTVMDFSRWGMSGAAPRFMGDDGGFCILHRVADRKDWIVPIPGREHHRSWCATVKHPDACLIAAAPDLLAALRGLIVGSEYAGGGLWDAIAMPSSAALNAARAAITKATGEGP